MAWIEVPVHTPNSSHRPRSELAHDKLPLSEKRSLSGARRSALTIVLAKTV